MLGTKNNIFFIPSIFDLLYFIVFHSKIKIVEFRSLFEPKTLEFDNWAHRNRGARAAAVAQVAAVAADIANKAFVLSRAQPPTSA